MGTNRLNFSGRLRNRKITPLAERRAYERILSGYIVEAKPGYFRDLLDAALELELPTLVRRERIFPRLALREFIPFGPLGLGLREMPRFEMIAGIFPREVVWDMEEWKAVKRIYSDEPMFALQFPTIPPEGVYEVERKVRPPITFTSTYWTRRLVGAERANELGYTGRGMLVAVSDTGCRYNHEQVVGRVIAETVLTGQPSGLEANGHGTHVSTTIGGELRLDDRLSRMVGVPIYCEGMVPECEILAIKSLGYAIGTGSTSGIIESIQMAIDRRADVINLSLGGPLQVT